MDTILSELEGLRIIPVVKIEQADDTAPLCDALAAGGLPVAEITFRTAAAAAAIRIAAKRGDILVGAGTVITVEQVKQSVDAGARFIVSPGFDKGVVEYCMQQSIPVTPGIATPTELQMALACGVEVVKFFPAEAYGGLKTLKALAAPFGQMRFIPTGGLSPANVLDYLRFPKVLACGGSWMVKADLIENKRFDEIEKITCAATELVNALE